MSFKFPPNLPFCDSMTLISKDGDFSCIQALSPWEDGPELGGLRKGSCRSHGLRVPPAAANSLHTQINQKEIG